MPFIYLDVLLFKSELKASHLGSIAYMILDQLVNWKCSTFSMASRVYVFNSVINSIFSHSFMVYKCHLDLLKDLNMAIRNKFWTNLMLKRKSH